MLKAILLDIDGTLVRSNDEHAQAWADALRQFGYDVPWQEIRSWIGMGGDKILPRIDQRLNDKEKPGTEISRVRQEIFLSQYLPQLRPQDGARALLEQLRARSLRRVAATSAKRDELDSILAAGGISGCIDIATTADDAARSKPDADVIEAALKKAGLSADEGIYLGDTPYDVAAAHKAEMIVVALRCGGWGDADLRDAEAIYDSPAELLRRLDESPIGRITESSRSHRSSR